MKTYAVTTTMEVLKLLRIEDSVLLRRWSLKVLTCECKLPFIKADLHIIVMDMRSGLCTYMWFEIRSTVSESGFSNLA